MNILALKTDNPDAQLHLITANGKDEIIWKAHKELSATLHLKIEDILKRNSLDISDIEGLVIYKGPGSFTGLRIGATVFNTMADSLNIPIVGSGSVDWLAIGVDEMSSGKNHKIVLPDYGGEANITKPRK